MALLRNILEKPVFRYGMLIYMATIIVSAFVFFIGQQQEIRFSLGDRIEVRVEKELTKVSSEVSKSIQSVRNDVNELKKTIGFDTDQYKKLISMLQNTDLSNFEKTLAASKSLDQFSTRVEKMEKELDGMKKSLNPTDPQLLTVARLGDKFELILSKISSVESKLQTIEKETEEKLKRNYDLAAAQVDRIVDMLKWVGLLLIPIIFTTIRDLFTPRKIERE